MKNVFVGLFLSLSVFTLAQTIGNSPYASFGIGDVKFDNTIDINSMGGISTAYISDFNNSFNFMNPAANSNLELTTLKFEVTNENSVFKSNFNSTDVTKHSSYVSNISIAFPVSKKLKFGLGFQPYSSKKYNILVKKIIEDNDTDDTNNNYSLNSFHGEGNLNTVQAGFFYSVTPEFALGLRTNFYFGNLYDINELTTVDVNNSPTSELVNGYETKNKIKSFNFTLGGTYQKKLQNDKKLTLGATYTFANTGKMQTAYTNSTYFYYQNEKVNINVNDEDFSKDKQLVPSSGSFGIGYGKDLKWFYGTQFDFKKGQSIQFLGQPFQYEDSYKISAGGWFVPNLNNFRNYFSRVIYRYGAYYEKGNLRINDKNINRFALTAGATFPFANKSASRLSGIDLGLEVGKRGTTENNLINQTFFNLRIGINFSDRWFQKALYD